MSNNAITKRKSDKSRMIHYLKHFNTLEKLFKKESLERSNTKVIVYPDFIKIGEQIDPFINKFQSWYFISKVIKIDFTMWLSFREIKNKLMKIITLCTELRVLNLSYCSKDWDDVH